MKILQRRAMPVAPYSVMHKDEMKSNQNFIANLDSEPEYYRNTVSPMLMPGQEAQLIYWLTTIGLLPQAQKCKNAAINNGCNNFMLLVPAHNMDVYQWRCSTCMEKRKIRDDTIFCNVKCKFGDMIKLLLGWSKGDSVEVMAERLSVKKAIVRNVYNIASNSAKDYLRSNISQFRLGGPGIVVLVDTYPDINSNVAAEPYCTKSRLILCIAEVKADPTRFYFQCLDRYSKTAKDLIENINTHALKIVQNIVLPGSVIVGNSHTTICSHNTLKRLKHIYPIMVGTDDLQRHDNPLQTLDANLEVIWQPALTVCEEAQFCRHAEVTPFLARYLFCQRFGEKTFEMLLNQLAY